MAFDFPRVRKLVSDYNFKPLFIEELGWDHHTGTLDVSVDGKVYKLSALAEKRGMVAFVHEGDIPDYATRRKIDRLVGKSVHQHFLIFTDSTRTEQLWQWVRRETGKPSACREHRVHRWQSGEPLVQKLAAIAFSLAEEETLTHVEVTGRVRAAFDVERITKRFYDFFQKEHATFLKFLKGIPDEDLERWYASVMLNRLMFIYFIQKKGFLDSNPDYLRIRLEESRKRGKDLFYRDFLCPLFFEGFAKEAAERSASTNRLLGKVPYLNGGLFLRHQIEEHYGKGIHIADAAFERLFDFFDKYRWHLDERPLRADNEINPDVLGYIFEKYINQKQMGAYYTKEDITGYISQNTVIPYLLDAARQKCKIAFEGSQSVWKLLQADPDRYIYPAVKKGVERPLPPEIAAGLKDVSKRTGWNKPAPEDYALPTEIWREVVARRKRYEEVRTKLSNGEVHEVNDLITYNLDIRQFAQDAIENSEGPELLRAFYDAIEKITVLDPTVGSGAFLFAALNILEPLYEACLDRMEVFLSDLERLGKKHRPEKFSDFRKVLGQVARHPNRRYFIFKSIVVNNLYGVDIMEEAVEICKLRLFLKLVAQIERVEDIEPLPDIDFNIRAGNTLVGYPTLEELKKSMEGDWVRLAALPAIEENAEIADRAFQKFHEMQTEHGMEAKDFADAKHEIKKRLKALEDELNRYLAQEYGVDPAKPTQYMKWLASHKPLHWFIEFYGIIKSGGFDVIIGNPPYVDYSKVRANYKILETNYSTLPCGNLYAFIIEKSILLSKDRFGFILPLSSTNANGNSSLQKLIRHNSILHVSHFAVRPSKLFVGVDMNLTIVCGAKRHSSPSHNTTTFNRWFAEYRDYLFSTLRYENHNLTVKEAAFPKFGTDYEVSIWNKLYSGYSRLSKYTVMTPMTSLSFHGFGRYWRKCILEKLSDNYQEFQIKSSYAPFAICLLNSQLSYWYWIVSSDCYRFTKTDALNLTVSIKADDSRYEKLSKALLSSYEKNSIIQKKVARNGVVTKEKQFFPVQSKSIIDEIDKLLAKQYGLTDEELDFIINYDIKYRLGRDSGEEEE